MKIARSLKRRYLRMRGCSEVVKNGFWFVDIPRTSSTSIRVELGEQFGPAYGKANVVGSDRVSDQMLKDHQPAKKMASMLGRETWDKLYTFSMVRNPWDRMYSFYTYRHKRGSLPESWSFKEYMLRLEDAVEVSKQGGKVDGVFSYHAMRSSAAYYLLDKSGTIMVDYVARYENRQDDLAKIAARIGISQLGGVSVQGASPKGTHYSRSYDDTTEKIVRRLYDDDITMFDYQFETKV